MYADIFDYNLKKINHSYNFFKNEKIKVSVNCATQNHFFLDNKIFDKKPGYYLYTSCKNQNSQHIIFIMRGWVHKKNINRIKNLPLKLKILGLKSRVVDALTINKHSNQIKKIKSFFIIQRLKNIVEDVILKNKKYFYIKVQSNNKYIYNVILNNNLQIKPIRHFFYSLQWFLFAITLFILYAKYNKKIRI